MKEVLREAPATGIYAPDFYTENEPKITPTLPIQNYAGMIRPQKDMKARELGDKCVQEVIQNKIADFERNEAYCARHGEDAPDLMVHVSTFIILNGMIYMTYYANTGNEREDPHFQMSRLAFCPENDPEDITIVNLQHAGDMLDGREVDCVYDTILMYGGGDELYLLWTASPGGNYFRLYCTFNIVTNTLGPILPNRFKVGDVTNDFSMSGMQAALTANGIPYKEMWSDIGIMQKLSTRVENGETYYYSGAYSGNFNCIIKSKDFITWEYVSTPDFINNSVWENATYVLGDKCYYFVRQQECEQGFLTCYDIANDTWAQPVLISDTQSRSDFIWYQNELYLFHAPINREGFGMIRINRDELAKSEVIFVADMKDSLFYPYFSVYGDDAYISYTIARKHIRLSKFNLQNYVNK